MAAKKKMTPRRTAGATATTSVDDALAALRRKGSKRNRDGMARYAITSKHVLGVSVADIRALAKRIGRDHALAAALWKTGIYEARMLACFVDDPARVTPAQMDRWAARFDNWALCDTACFHLFDKTPHAFAKAYAWAADEREFVKRASFALMASLALHDRATGDAPFGVCLPLIEDAADDERNFVKKGVSWALRGIGRRSAALHAASLALARDLSSSESRAARWIGRDAARDLAKAKVRR